jgi:PAS domain S-box-containing protein
VVPFLALLMRELPPLELEVARLRAKISELELESLGASLGAIASQIPDNLIVVDRAYRILFINWTVPDLATEDVLGTDVNAYVPEHQRKTTLEACERAFTTGENVRFPVEYFAADGSISRWETRVVPLRNGAGEIDRLLQISTNITDREEATADLSRFFQVSLDMLCVATPSGYFKRVSPAFTATLGWTEEELRATAFVDFVHPEDQCSTREVFERLLRGGPVIDFENRYRCKGGGHRILEWRAIAEPHTGLVHAAARDITERRALKESLRHARKMEAVGRLASGVAHDFNNLILAIGLNAELARRTGGQLQLDEIRMAAERAAALTRQLLLFSRREPVKAQPADLNRIVTDLLRMLSRAFAASIRIDVEMPSEPLFVLADPSQLEQVLMNLCLNARDAMPDGGLLRIRTERAAPDARNEGENPSAPVVQYARLTVSDTGTGIAPEIRDRIFEPFFTTKPPGSGTGLGLSTVYGIVEQHHGVVTVWSERGHGTRFEIKLPMSDEADAVQASEAEEPVRGGSETLLVAEDFENVRRVVVNLLESVGYRVLTAAHGDAALRCLRSRGDEISLALLDVMMPFKTGPEVAVLAAQTHPRVRFLFTSGYTDVPGALSSIPEDRVLRKPYVRDDLLRRVRRALDEPPSSE